MNCTTQLAKLEEKNAMLQAKLDSMSKQTVAAHTAGPFIALARQFLGDAQKVDGIKKSIQALTNSAELLDIQKACADQSKRLIEEQSCLEVGPNEWIDYVVAQKSFCEVCEKKRRSVAWFTRELKHPDHDRGVYSACKNCICHVCVH